MATRSAPKAVATAAAAAARAPSAASGPLGLDAASAGRLNAERMVSAQKFLVLRTASVALDAATGSLLPAPAAPAAPASFGAPVPSDAPRPDRGGAQQFRKRLRLHAHWRLQPARRWVDFGPFISAISITYDPALEGSVGARELARQVQSEKARSRFSKIDIVVKESDDGQPGIVQVKWVRAHAPRVYGAVPGERWCAQRLTSLSPALPPLPPRLRARQNNDKTSFAPAQFHTFEEILEYFEVPRMTLMREQEDAEML